MKIEGSDDEITSQWVYDEVNGVVRGLVFCSLLAFYLFKDRSWRLSVFFSLSNSTLNQTRWDREIE
jgi:hypothetical protein